MKKSLTTAVLAGLAFALAGVAALAGATSVSTEPEPAFVTRRSVSTTSPAATTSTTSTASETPEPPVTVDDHGGNRGRSDARSDSSHG
jgi:hypothetical protein